MPGHSQSEPQSPRREPFGTRMKRAALAIGFGIVLVIPRLRRLRRRVWLWSFVRIFAALSGAALVWRFVHSPAGIAPLLIGATLLAFGTLVGARPETRSIDDTRRELGALVALDGGSFSSDSRAKPVRNTTIFVCPDRLALFQGTREKVGEIGLTLVRQVEVQRVTALRGKHHENWELRIAGDDSLGLLRFRYEGAFSEHLARVAADTILSVWKKSLPVLQKLSG
jgi:hypothetical protein